MNDLHIISRILIHGIGTKLISTWKKNVVCTRKRLSMLTGLKVSSLACKCVFYRPEHNAKGVPMEMNFEDLEMQKLNKPTDITQRVNEKMGSFV